MNESHDESFAAQTAPAEDQYVEFWPAGARGKGRFECVACGHGATVYHLLPRCPSCGERLWERADWSPFAPVIPK